MNQQEYKVNENKNSLTDPTSNVLQLVEAAVKRLDDLRASEMKRIDEQIRTHFEHYEKLNIAEAKRIDAIRAVDVGAVAIASERAAAQALVLANQVSVSAETLRTLVASTAATVAAQLQQVSSQLTERLSLLEKAQYEGTGKAKVADPIMEGLLIEMKSMRELNAGHKGKSEITNPILLAIFAAAGGLIVFLIEKALS